MTSYKPAYDSDRIRQVFGNLSIDKARLPSSGLTKIGVPSFVAEWLLDKVVPGSGQLTQEESEKVNNFVRKAFPQKDDANVILYKVQQGEIYKLIALLQVRVKLERGIISADPVAIIPTLNLHDCQISTDLINRHQTLLRQGIWGKISIGCMPDGKTDVIDFDPFQCSSVDLDQYAACRAQFNTQDWLDLLFCSMGYNPENPAYTHNAKTWVISRLLPLVERNYHMMELAPKGTGKSYVFENISSKVAIISGGKVTPAQLFINGRTKEVGLLGRHDVVVLDEVQSLSFDDPNEVIGPLKNYLASGRYNRAGFAEVSSDCSLVLLANIELDAELKPKNPHNLVSDLPQFFSETAFLDRFAGIVPGWEIPKFNREMSAYQVGLKMDFFGEALLGLRQDSRFVAYAQNHTKFNHTVSIRDQDAILKSASGYLKLLYPHLNLTLADYERDCLKPACKLRQSIRNSLYYLDDEFRQYGREILVEVG
jgi:ATP-dependent Lon protease